MPIHLSCSMSALLAIVLLALAGCTSTPTAEADYDTDYDFSQVQTIFITPFQRNAPDTVRISDLQVGRVNEALAQELGRRGFELVDERSAADMLMTWHLITDERADVRTYNTASYYNCWRCGGIGAGASNVSVNYYTVGTLIVDMIDPRSLRSVWRSVLESRLRSKPGSEEAAEQRSEAAAQVFAQFPPVPNAN